jgi:hypothetical protein
MCWSEDESKKLFGWHFGWLLEREGRKPLEFLFWTTNGMLGFQLLWVLSSCFRFAQRKIGLRVLCGITLLLTCFVVILFVLFHDNDAA